MWTWLFAGETNRVAQERLICFFQSLSSKRGDVNCNLRPICDVCFSCHRAWIETLRWTGLTISRGLEIVQLSIVAASAFEFVMRAEFNEARTLEYHD